NRAVRADAERQGEHRDGRERRAFAQLPEAEDDILPERVEPLCTSHVPLPLLTERVEGPPNCVDVAEATPRLVARDVRGHASGDQLVDRGLEMKLELVADVGACVGAPEPEIAPPGGNAIGVARHSRLTPAPDARP